MDRRLLAPARLHTANHLLVGGPGNGKTEAIESTIGWLDHSLGRSTDLVRELSLQFADASAPRVARARGTGPRWSQYVIDVVQDASLPSAGRPGVQPFQLSVDELASALSCGESEAYLCCVNRGVLDDALVYAIDQKLQIERALLEAITRSVSLEPSAPSCWPLQDFASVAVWPMDAESLLLPIEGEGSAIPAQELLRRAIVGADRKLTHLGV